MSRDKDKIDHANVREYLETLDLAYRAVDACGGTGASKAFNAALDEAINAIANLGGMDPAERKQKGFPTSVKIVESGEDGGPFFRLYQMPVGHVMTHQDIADLVYLLNAQNDEAGVDMFHEGRTDAFRQIGGEELVKAVETESSERVQAIFQEALAKHNAKRKTLS